MGNLASLTFMLGANIRDFQTKMRKASQTMAKTGKQMKSVGKSMSMYATAPLAAIGVASVAAFDKQAQAEARLAVQLKQNGKNVEATMAEYKQYASELQNVTTVGDEVTLGLMQMAETMGAVDTKSAVTGAIGLSKALGVDLNQAIKMVTLAEQGEYTMLNRYVPSLRSATTESEKATIVAKLYADGLELAKIQAQTGLGPMQQLGNTIGDISEEFGKIISEAIAPAVEWLRQVAESFKNLSERGKKTIAVIATIVAGIGPLLVIFGTLLTVLPMIGAALTAMLGPVGLVILAIAAIAAAFAYVYDNWIAFKERLTDWNWLKNAAIDVAIFMAKTLTLGFRTILDALGIDFITPAIEYFESFKAEVKDNKTEFKSFGDSMKSVASEVVGSLGLMGKEGDDAFNTISGAAKSTHAGIARIKETITALGKTIVNVAPQFDFTPEQPDVPLIPNIIYRDDLVGEQLDAAQINYKLRVAKFGKKAVDTWDNAMEGIQHSIAGVITDIGVTIGESLGDMISGIDPAFGSDVLMVFGNFLKQIGTMMITYGALMLAMTILMENPWTAVAAIAVGILGVAAGQLMMNKAKSGPAKMATGGIVPPGFSGDTYPALLSSGETVIPNPIPLGSFGGGESNNIKISGTLVGRGDQLLAVVDTATKHRTRTRGY